jgi:hypothetical protein
MVAPHATTVAVGRPRRSVPAARMSAWWEDLVAALLGWWIMLAVYLDGRAHELGLPDSFFTVWHGLLYGGVLVLAGWLLAMGWRRRQPGLPHPGVRLALPAGYNWALAGVGLFLVGGVADLAWHTVFGIEAGLDALLSPSHLLLFTSGALMLSGPLQAARAKAADPTARSHVGVVPVVLSVTALAALAAFALSFLSAFLTHTPTQPMMNFPEGTPEHVAAETSAIAGLGSYVVTSLVLVVPLAWLTWFWRVPLGLVTVFLTVMASLAVTLLDFTGATVIAAAALAGLAVDTVLATARRAGATRRAQALTTAVSVPLLVWTAQLVNLKLTEGVRWSAELVGGVVALSALVSAALVLVLTSSAWSSRSA